MCMGRVTDILNDEATETVGNKDDGTFLSLFIYALLIQLTKQIPRMLSNTILASSLPWIYYICVISERHDSRVRDGLGKERLGPWLR